MSTEPLQRRIGRRKLLTGAAGGAMAVGAAAIIGCGDDDDEQAAPDWGGQVVSRFVRTDVPEDPWASLWDRAPRVEIPMQPQSSALPLRMQPSVPAIRVRSLNDGKRIGFLLEWSDPQRDQHAVKTTQFRDGCGVLLGPPDVPAAYFMMGVADRAASILHWRADWQKDIDDGFQDLESAFPNVAFDFYPPLVDAPRPLVISDDYPERGRPWLPGMHAGNPLSQPTKRSPVERLLANGPGTITHLPTQDATGRGIWNEGRWKVVLTRELDASNAEEVGLKAGSEYALAFTVWAGSEGDRGSRKSPSNLGKLLIGEA
jgi:hypothetical protein